MRNLKKFLALVLSVMMVMSLAITASAHSIDNGDKQVFNDNSAIESKFVTAVEVLNGMDVLKGDADASGNATGNFRPASPITRAEVAAMVFRLATGTTSADGADHFAQYGNFSDVRDDAWYAGYVGFCANAKYIKGYAGEYGPFGPTDNVTGYQALAMILRAVGYGVNGEFEGASWQLEVAAIAEQTGILKNINSTSFGGATLQQAARRDVVAEIFFQAAQLDRVVYTPAFGYQTTNVNSGIAVTKGQNSLGYINFGLTHETRVVVGNQATGESSTRLGLLTTERGSYEYADDSYVYWNEYDYPGTVLVKENELLKGTGNDKDVMGRNIVTVPAGRDIDLKSGLDLFGHKIEVFYNAKTPGSVKQTYAYYDRAVLDKMVYANSGLISDLDLTDLGAQDAKDDSVVGLGTRIAGAGFTVKATDTVYVSDRYGQIDTANDSLENDSTAARYTATGRNEAAHFTAGVTDGTDAEDVDGAKPYGLTALGGTADGYDNGVERGFFRVISNDGDKKPNVVITLAPELARLTEANTTVGNGLLLAGNSNATLGTTPSTFGQKDNGWIRKASLTSSSVSDLGEVITAWEIKGTNYDYDRDYDFVKGNSNLYNYQLNKLTTVTGVVQSYNPSTGRIDFANKSYDFTLLPIISQVVSRPAVDQIRFGVEYTLYLDELGQYVRAVPATGYEFLYGTFADHEVGGLGTGTIKYAITGVNWAGEKVLIQELKSIDGVPVSGINYEALMIAKKNMGGATSHIGNEMQKGFYTGYGYNKSTGDLDTMDFDDDGNFLNVKTHRPNSYWDGHMGDAGTLTDIYNGQNVGSATFQDANTKQPANPCDCAGLSSTTQWNINKSDVANGFADLNNPTHGLDTLVDGTLLATPNTKFIIVDGTGSDTLSVDIRTGISGLLGDSDSVVIDLASARVPLTNVVDTDEPFYNIYYKTTDDQYNNIDTSGWVGSYNDRNEMVDVVILPKAAVTWSSTNTVYFTNRLGSTGTLLADTAMKHQIYQYTLWQNGESKTYFVDTTISSGQTDNTTGTANGAVATDVNEGTFYDLTKVREINGTPIYRADEIVDTDVRRGNPAGTAGNDDWRNICETKYDYHYVATNNTATARLTDDNGVNAIFNVANAKVTNLSGTGTITDVRTLNNAISIGYQVTVAIVNEGMNVSHIYVTQVQATNVWNP